MGYEVHGIYMSNWDVTDENEEICHNIQQDYNDALQISQQLQLKSFKQVNYVKEYWQYVFSDMLSKYEDGLTPNPDINCNRYIKFHQLYHEIMNNTKKYDYFSTGHYVSNTNQSYPLTLTFNDKSTITISVPKEIDNETNHLHNDDDDNSIKKWSSKLMIPKDGHKDQSYFLAHINPLVLNKTIFPLAYLNKSTVRFIANKLQLSIANKKDSVGICFIGKRKFSQFISEYLIQKPGTFIDIDDINKKMPIKHQGISTLTIGQNAKIPNLKEKYYVCNKDVKKNIIYVCNSWSHSSLYNQSITLKDIHFY